MDEPIRFVCGLLFSADRRRVALIRKKRPSWQVDRLNGIGGKVEENETPHWAMVREFEEEAGLRIPTWQHVAVLSGPGAVLHFYAAFYDRLHEVRTMTDEEVITAYVRDVLGEPDLIPNLRVMIPLALDETGIVKPVLISDQFISGRARAA